MSLPQEIIEIIIGLAVPQGDDKLLNMLDEDIRGMLYNCCLVSHAFLPISRALLWRYIDCSEALAFEALRQYDHLPPLVKILSIDCPRDEPQPEHIEVLTHIEHLVLYGRLEFMPGETTDHIRENWPQLRTITFMEATFDDPSYDVVSLLRDLSMVKEVQFIDNEGTTFDPVEFLAESTWDEPVAQLDSLYFNFSESTLPIMHVVLERPTSIFSVQKLKKLTLSFYGFDIAQESMAMARRLMEAVAPTLQELSFRYPSEIIGQCEPLALAELTGLRRLSFNIYEEQYMRPTETISWWTANLQQALRSKGWSLEEVQVNIVLYADDVRQGIFYPLRNTNAWHALGDVLSRMNVQCLVVRIHRHERVEDEQLAEFESDLRGFLRSCFSLASFSLEKADRFWEAYH
ncbi:hypothetical protein CYLTODRAFT_494518 [Cylindrobasidium torrendii FP15055 ss-10]|uniref:F-box domain-containing protein n=1 Tax=Cylindrobasidium torrendii FP15055 ss-10 TaxID=1314674 RepID=A0A0D7AXK9_9AGAR|nr:hypothetical protein CYLTODRAFT_494518 [Cylindrobasidium torrendii FP15055 ss-10]